MKRASAGDVEPAFIVASLYHTAKAYDIVTCMCSQPPWLAVGFESGAISLFNKGDDMALPALLAGHAGGTLCAAFSSARACLASGGGDGCVRTVACAAASDASVECWQLNHARSGATATASGALIETVAAGAERWAAIVGRYIAVGLLRSEGAVASPLYLGPLGHVIDGVQLLGDASVAAASYGGVTLWAMRQHDGDVADSGVAEVDNQAPRPHPLDASAYQRVSLPAARRTADASLACDGWARSLLASPNGSWLAASVTVAGAYSSKLWLWRLRDGADFECGGFDGPISALSWSGDSSLLASCSGPAALVWSFNEASSSSTLHGGPAGGKPRRFTASPSLRLVSAAFDRRRAWLACGADDGSVVAFCIVHATPTLVLNPTCTMRDVGSLGPLEYLGWVGPCGHLAVAGCNSGVVATCRLDHGASA